MGLFSLIRLIAISNDAISMKQELIKNAILIERTLLNW